VFEGTILVKIIASEKIKFENQKTENMKIKEIFTLMSI